MRAFDSSTPVVVLTAQIAALHIMRSLGKKGVSVYAVDSGPDLPAFRSRFCAGKLELDLGAEDTAATAERLVEWGRGLGRPAVLFWTSDETAVLCARHYDVLSECFLMPRNDVELVDRLQDKAGMYELAREHGVPVPHTDFPQCEDDVRRLADEVAYPILLKGIIGTRLLERTGRKMRFAYSPEELLSLYREMEDPEHPNIMLQEVIPGGDDQVYIFNGYFDADSECLNPYTGHKLRQYPVHRGCASLGICKTNEQVSLQTRSFMKALGYRGVLDIGYRLDPRDGQYKVLDVNPRIGQAFRIFVGTNNEDVARDMYLDLTGQPREKSTPREGRLWVIEDFDFLAMYDYRTEGTLTFRSWLRSFRNLEEGAWWWWRDPLPFVLRMASFLSTQLPRRIRGTARRVRGLARESGAGR